MQSRRLPGKPLRPICGLPLLAWVYHRARKCALIDRLTVATDSGEISAYCEEHGMPAILTSDRHLSGTDRLIEVMDRDAELGQLADIYLNIQGDEPMVSATHIGLLIKPLVNQIDEGQAMSPAQARLGDGAEPRFQGRSRVQVSTLKVKVSAEEASDPNAVKVVTDSQGLALYFSRATIPYDRDRSGRASYFKHLGFYAYTAEALRRFRSLPPSPLEQLEQLEQLRFLENGIPIAVVETAEDTIGVDTEEDLRRVEEHFRRAEVGV